MAVSDTLSPDVTSLKEENQRLRRAVEELTVINDLARAISASMDPEEIMGTIIRRSLRAVHGEQGVITLVEQSAVDPMKTLVRANTSSSEHEQFHLNQALLGWMHLNKKPLTVNSPRSDERFRGVKWDESISSLLCVPLMLKSELRGVLTIYNRKDGREFTDDDQRLLAIIAAQSAQIVENARLNEREKQFLKMQEEVSLAARIQSGLLPQKPPTVPGYDIAGKNIPAQIVGGDHFDFIPEENNRIAICLGDVSGKGLPASLLMANLQATLRSQIFSNPSPKKCVQISNRLLFQSTGPEKFATLFYCLLDLNDHSLTFTNAGHDFPFVIRKNEPPMRLKTGGLAVGMLEDFPFEEETIALQPGDVLVICSDGIGEAMDIQHQQYGEERLEKIITANIHASATEIIEKIVGDVRSHVNTAPQMDDMTLVVVKRTA